MCLFQQWAQALSSDNYPKGKTYLKLGDRYTVTGVLCDLHRRATGGEWSDRDAYLREMVLMPQIVYKWAAEQGITTSILQQVERMSETENQTFRQIAEWLVQQVPVIPEPVVIKEPEPEQSSPQNKNEVKTIIQQLFA